MKMFVHENEDWPVYSFKKNRTSAFDYEVEIDEQLVKNLEKARDLYETAHEAVKDKIYNQIQG